MVDFNNMQSWSSGLNANKETDEPATYDHEYYAQKYLEKIRKHESRALRRARSIAVSPVIKKQPKTVAEVPKSVTLSGDTHMSDISNFLSHLITGSDPHSPVRLHGGYAAQTPKGHPIKAAPKSVIVDIDTFTKNFLETAPQKFSVDTFRKYQTPPKLVIDSYEASNKSKVLEQAWSKVRQSLGFEGDCRYPWEKINDMSLAEIVAVEAVAEITLPASDNLVQYMRGVFDHPVSEESLKEHQAILKSAKDKLESITHEKINSKAVSLSHHDLSAIRNWGKDFDNARVEALRALHDNTIKTALHTDSKIGQVNAELVKLLRAKKPGKLSSTFIGIGRKRPKKGIQPIEKDANGVYQWVKEPVDYRFMSAEDKKQAEEQLIQELENVMREAMDLEEDRIAYAEDAALIAGRYQLLLNQHRRALAKNRTRILTEAKNGSVFNIAAQENSIVSQDKMSHALSAVDDRIEALDESAEICERERKHYESIAALHHMHKKNLRMAVNRSIERLRDFERKQQQVILTQNVALAGQYGLNLEGVKLNKQIEIVTERLQEARISEIETLNAMKKAMDTDEILVLDYQAPIALIEHQKTLALPAPQDDQGVNISPIVPTNTFD